MKSLLLLRFVLFVGLLFGKAQSVFAQTYSSVVSVPVAKWDFTVFDTNGNPVATLMPSTHYFLGLHLNSGVTVNDLYAYIIQDGDGWYFNEQARPQQFPTGTDVDFYSPTGVTYYSFYTVEASDFSGAFFKIRLSANGSSSGPVSVPKSKIFQ